VAARADLSPGEWAVLALVGEGPTHGWAVARALAPDGELGRVWTFPRALVYRALEALGRDGLIAQQGFAEGERGPTRTIVAATPEGRARVQEWLGLPVEHVRDARSLLLLKLAVCRRWGVDPRPLLVAQREVLARAEGAQSARSEAGDDTERLLAAFRLESTRAVARFVEAQLAALDAR
jgi:DNA-binding PadR family transcriptional regulator